MQFPDHVLIDSLYCLNQVQTACSHSKDSLSLQAADKPSLQPLKSIQTQSRQVYLCTPKLGSDISKVSLILLKCEQPHIFNSLILHSMSFHIYILEENCLRMAAFVGFSTTDPPIALGIHTKIRPSYVCGLATLILQYS